MHFQPTNARHFSTSKKQRFRFKYYAPHAQKVYVGGNFNPLHSKFMPMIKGKSGFWHAHAVLPAGHYEYAFYVDGEIERTRAADEITVNSIGTHHAVS